jgi:glycolate oxidase FAD binding subunit
MLDGRGQDLAFGGRVMKNVAGFDLPRLMTGALGTLGLLTEISLKCLPAPKVQTTRVLECGVNDAIRIVNEWRGKPLPISATCHRGSASPCACPGPRRRSTPPCARSAASVTRRRCVLGGIREQTDASSPERARLRTAWRLSVKASVPYRRAVASR